MRASPQPTGYTVTVPEPPDRASLRSDHVLQTRSALVDAARRLFGEQGFASTGVGDIAREARVTSGALYHHFPTKTALFEAVFSQIHEELTVHSAEAALAGRPDDPIDGLARGCEAFLDDVLDPVVQRIIIIDAPAVLGLARFTELDERHAITAIVEVLTALHQAGAIRAEDPETLARLFMGAVTRGAMLIANSDRPRHTRDAVAAAMRQLLAGLAAP
jgi:AcrR family transcriptional regulator